MKRHIISVLTALILLTAMCTTAFAHDVPDMTRTGSVSVTMRHSGGTVSSGTLTIFRVGDVREDDGNYSFVLNDDFAGCGVELDDLQSASLPETLAEYARDHAMIGVTQEIGEDGKVEFAGLELGLYLVVQYEASEGYNAANPFLVSVPANVDGTYIYDVDATPKVEPVTPKPAVEPTEPPETQPKDPMLPQTGQLKWPVAFLAALGTLLFVFGWILRYSKRNEKHGT